MDTVDYAGITDIFLKEYGSSEGNDIRAFFAPLRVNLIGEYTDIAGGRVLPCALDLGICAAARKRSDNTIRLKSADEAHTVSINIDRALKYEPEDGWANYPKGVVNELLKLGKQIGGADIAYASNAFGLTAAGLSSSAAIEVLTGVIFNSLFNLGIDGVEMALLSQRAENRFVGVMCGIMDQFSVMMGKSGNAILLNCGSLDYKYIPFEPEKSGLRLVIMNTNKKRGLLDSKYNERRAEAESALNDLIDGGVISEGGYLCSITQKELESSKALIKSETCLKRAKHLIGENERVQAAADALLANDFNLFAELLNRSHKSLKDDFCVTGPELDAIQEAAAASDGCIGARMTGAGFGGCALAIVYAQNVDSFIRSVSQIYTEKTGLEAGFHVCGASDGAGERSVKNG